MCTALHALSVKLLTTQPRPYNDHILYAASLHECARTATLLESPRYLTGTANVRP